MQSFSSSAADHQPRLLAVELWGVGDVALALPFLQTAAQHARVTLLAQSHAAPLVRRFCPEVELLPFHAPWTAFRGKYRLHRWPWREISALVATLRQHRFTTAVSARPDPRDHFLLAASRASQRVGFPRFGSGLLLNSPLTLPENPHRSAAWSALANRLGWKVATATPAPRSGKNIVIHTGAAQPTRIWPRDRFETIATRLQSSGWQVTLLDGRSGNLDDLLQKLLPADRFLGNDSGPGHLAALLGVPTFTIFGAQLSERFSPVHPQAAWIDGAPCEFKPCNDYCRFPEPYCIRKVSVDQVWERLSPWLNGDSRGQ